jgi:hypothetical protein
MSVETVTTNFTSFTMQRVNKRNRLYQDKDFEVQSLTSLVKIAKERTIEKMESPTKGPDVNLPLHEVTERLTESLEQMHHNLQSLLMQKLGPDARNIIAAERARQTRAKQKTLQEREPEKKEKDEAHTLADIGSDGGDELQMLNAYRERYATMLAELAVARDSLVELEKRLLEEGLGPKDFQRRISKESAELDKEDRRRRRRSSAISDLSDLSEGGNGRPKGRRLRRRSTGDSSGAADKVFKWNNVWK